METNNPFKIGDKVYHYSTKEAITILKFTQDNLMAFVDYRYNLIKTSELSFKPYDLIKGGLTHKRLVDFSILNETDWFYVELNNSGYHQKWYCRGDIFERGKSINYSLDTKQVYRHMRLSTKEMATSIRKCNEKELEKLKTIFPEEFKQKSLFERIEHEIKMSSSPVSGIIISDEDDPCETMFDIRSCAISIPIYRSKTNMLKGKIILF